MSGEREGEHPARAYGATGGGFAEDQADPEQFEEDKQVGSFATGEEDPEKFPEDEKLGSFARGQDKTDTPANAEEGTFAAGPDDSAEDSTPG
jgi:hypothetical protein